MPQIPAGFVPDGFEPDAAPPVAAARPSAASRFGSELYAKSPIPAAVAGVQGAANVVAHPLDTLFGIKPVASTVASLAKAQWDQAVKAAQKAKEATQGGGVLSASEAFGHGLAAVIPILGPAAADVGERWGNSATAENPSGDVAGMLGGTMGLLAPFALKYGLELKNAPNPKKADILRRGAEQTVSQRVLAPGNPRYKPTAERIAPEVLKRGAEGNRLELQQWADEGMASAADAIDAAIATKGATAPVAVQPLVAALTKRVGDFTVNGDVIPTAVGKVKQLEGLRDYLAKRGPTIPFDELRKVRDEFYATADQAKGYQGPDVTVPDVGWAAREAGSTIRQQMAKDRPELVGPNADYTFFKRLGDVLDPSLGRPKHVSASPTGVTGGNSTAGAIIGGAAALGSNIPGLHGVAALVGSRLLPALLEAKNSPAWQLATAQQKMKLAAAIEAGNMSKAKVILLGITKMAPRQQTEATP